MHADALVDGLKRILKARDITYAEVAAGLRLSEASIKRMFSRRDFTLARLEEVCRVAGIDFGDLAREVTQDEAGIAYLTVEQEEEIVSDPRLMLVALCAVGNWTLAQMLETYAIPEPELIGYLVRLDRRKIIELGAENRIRPLISRTFAWIPDGPIQRYFRSRVESEYLSSKFDRPGEMFLFVSGMLSRGSTADLIGRMRRVASEFADLHRADRSLPLTERHGTSALLAIRSWEPKAFRALRRHDEEAELDRRSLHPMQDRGRPKGGAGSGGGGRSSGGSHRK